MVSRYCKSNLGSSRIHDRTHVPESGSRNRQCSDWEHGNTNRVLILDQLHRNPVVDQPVIRILSHLDPYV